MSSTISFLRLDADALATLRLDDQGQPAEHGRPVGRVLGELARREEWDLLDELLEQPTRIGLHPLVEEFRGAWAFFDDLTHRLPAVRDSEWVRALDEGEARLPAAAADDPALAGLLLPGWVVLDPVEVEQLHTAARDALAADPDWATAGHANGPAWQQLVLDLDQAAPTPHLLVVVR